MGGEESTREFLKTSWRGNSTILGLHISVHYGIIWGEIRFLIFLAALSVMGLMNLNTKLSSIRVDCDLFVD